MVYEKRNKENNKSKTYFGINIENEKKTCISCKHYDDGFCFINEIEEEPLIINFIDEMCEEYENLGDEKNV